MTKAYELRCARRDVKEAKQKLAAVLKEVQQHARAAGTGALDHRAFAGLGRDLEDRIRTVNSASARLLSLETGVYREG
jgi:hypothetical protein